MTRLCDLISQGPSFKINWDESVKTSYTSDGNDENIITVEQGTPFLLKFEFSAWPIPNHVDLYKDGRKVNISQSNGTIFVGLDRVSIPRVDKQSYAGKYKISATNSAGEGTRKFELKVRGEATNSFTLISRKFFEGEWDKSKLLRHSEGN